MRRPRDKRQTAASQRAAEETRKGWVKIVGVLAVVGVIATTFIVVSRSNRSLDTETLCPTTPSSVTVLLVDVTDPMTVAQRQDFQNQLTKLRNSIPRYGKLIVAKVDSTSQTLLKPVIVRCNPGTADDVSDWTGDPKGVQKQYREGFEKPLADVFSNLSIANGSDRSPIFESVQSVALTELLTPDVIELQRTLILASDLLQNTDTISFYAGLPEPDELINSAPFRRVRSDLRQIEIEIWMLERADAPQTQPRALSQLWETTFTEQGGSVRRIYNVSG
jgi:hypothetical protein